MEHWEFLLQKEGDRSWLPLDSPDVEILEGRYRIVARSGNVNATIDTRIAHLATSEVPPKRRVQKRSCRTNHDGLMVVIPFTHLEPGQWELSCSPADLMTDLMTGAQPYAIKLQVVAREAEEEWEPDWSAPDASGLAPDVSHSDKASSLPLAERTIASESTIAPATTLQETGTVDRTLPLETPVIAADAFPSTEPAPVQTTAMPPEVAEILAASMDRLFQIAEQMSDQLVDEVLQDFDLTAIADAPVAVDALEHTDHAVVNAANETDSLVNHSKEPVDVSAQSSGYTLAAHETFVLTLAQSAFVAVKGEVISLAGQVAIGTDPVQQPSESPRSTPSQTDKTVRLGDSWDGEVSLNLNGATAQALQLCLRDPQSLQILVTDRQPLPQSPFPCPFTFTFSLPETFATHLVLGEVVLCGTLSAPTAAPTEAQTAAQTENSIALLTQSFSITVDPNALVDELAKLHDALTQEIDDEERLDLPLELSSRLQEQATPSLDLSFLDLAVVQPSPEPPPRFPSLAGQPLPPQLYQPDPEQMRSKTLDLPAFKLTPEPAPAPEATSDRETTPAQPRSAQTPIESSATEKAMTTDSDAEATSIALNPIADVASVATDTHGLTLSEPAAPLEAETVKDINANSPVPTSLDLPSPTHMAFQSLKLQDRFLTRLASLATDTELSALLKANLAPDGLTFAPPLPTSEAETRSLMEEIVVDDVPPQNERRRKQPSADSEQTPLEAPPNLLVLPADDPVPTPTLDVTTGELTAGKAINIRVKLPNLLPRIYVKLWVTDRQTRSLLDGPRWLVDFLPNGLGDLEAMLPLTVPFGSVELRFEAIAVEMHTQRESHKVTIDRVVVPPDLPIVSLDDFSGEG